MYLSDRSDRYVDLWYIHFREVFNGKSCWSGQERQINIGRIDLRPGQLTCYPSGGISLSHRALLHLPLLKIVSYLSYYTIIQQSQARTFQFQFIEVFFTSSWSSNSSFVKLVCLFTVKFICGTAGMATAHFYPIYTVYRLFLGMVLPTEIHSENYLNATILSEFFCFIFRQQRKYLNLMSQRSCMK